MQGVVCVCVVVCVCLEKQIVIIANWTNMLSKLM